MTEDEIRNATQEQLRVMVAERLGWKYWQMDRRGNVVILPPDSNLPPPYWRRVDRPGTVDLDQLPAWPDDIALATRLALDHLAETNWQDFSIMVHNASFVGAGFRAHRYGSEGWPPKDNYIIEGTAEIEGDESYQRCIERAMATAICRAWLLAKLTEERP